MIPSMNYTLKHTFMTYWPIHFSKYLKKSISSNKSNTLISPEKALTLLVSREASILLGHLQSRLTLTLLRSYLLQVMFGLQGCHAPYNVKQNKWRCSTSWWNTMYSFEKMILPILIIKTYCVWYVNPEYCNKVAT